MTSDESWSNKLRKITELERPDHWHLEATDECYFLGNYTPRAGYSHSATNQIISNLKKSPTLRHTAQWPHKLKAIRQVAAALSANINADARHRVTIVPVPPSKTRDHPEFDDRMTQVARHIPGITLCECIQTVQDRCAAHATDEPRSLQELRATLDFEPGPIPAEGQFIFVLDDVLTTGRSFKVIKAMLLELRPGANITGMFAARCARPAITFDFDDLTQLL